MHNRFGSLRLWSVIYYPDVAPCRYPSTLSVFLAFRSESHHSPYIIVAIAVLSYLSVLCPLPSVELRLMSSSAPHLPSPLSKSVTAIAILSLVSSALVSPESPHDLVCHWTSSLNGKRKQGAKAMSATPSIHDDDDNKRDSKYCIHLAWHSVSTTSLVRANTMSMTSSRRTQIYATQHLSLFSATRPIPLWRSSCLGLVWQQRGTRRMRVSSSKPKSRHDPFVSRHPSSPAMVLCLRRRKSTLAWTLRKSIPSRHKSIIIYRRSWPASIEHGYGLCPAFDPTTQVRRTPLTNGESRRRSGHSFFPLLYLEGNRNL